jgi:mitotic spindle assembly checkpoint protein MAD2
MKQITSSVTFLPMLDEPCQSTPASPSNVSVVCLQSRPSLTGTFHCDAGTFNILAYTSTSDAAGEDAPVPEQWAPSDAHLIDPSKVEQVRLRSFSTNVHKLEALVAYKLD